MKCKQCAENAEQNIEHLNNVRNTFKKYFNIYYDTRVSAARDSRFAERFKVQNRRISVPLKSSRSASHQIIKLPRPLRHYSGDELFLLPIGQTMTRDRHMASTLAKKYPRLIRQEARKKGPGKRIFGRLKISTAPDEVGPGAASANDSDAQQQRCAATYCTYCFSPLPPSGRREFDRAPATTMYTTQVTRFHRRARSDGCLTRPSIRPSVRSPGSPGWLPSSHRQAAT